MDKNFFIIYMYPWKYYLYYNRQIIYFQYIIIDSFWILLLVKIADKNSADLFIATKRVAQLIKNIKTVPKPAWIEELLTNL